MRIKSFTKYFQKGLKMLKQFHEILKLKYEVIDIVHKTYIACSG